jgi:hypothetical protein
MERRLEYRPAVEVFVNDAGTITICTEQMGGDSLVALHPDQVLTVIQWLQECLEELRAEESEGPEDQPPVPSPARYAKALSELQSRLSQAQRALLVAHFRAPDRTATARQLAAAAGLSNWRAVNSQYGRLGTMLREALGYAEGGQKSYIIASFVRPGVAGNAEWLWVMHPELASALGSLGWGAVEATR